MSNSIVFRAATALCLSLGFASAAYATHINNYTIWDNINDADNHPTGTENQYSYWGGMSANKKYQNLDVIGSASQFNIEKAILNHDDNTLTIDIYTGFVSNGGLGSHSGITYNNTGIGLGDLFLTTTGWNPTGTAADHYSTDQLNNTGTSWNYVLSLGDNRWDPDSNPGDAILYEITNSNSYLISDDFLSGGTYRNGQLIAVDRALSGLENTGNSASWDGVSNTDFIRFVMNIDGTSMADENNSLGIHWAMTCGNDVLEGDPPVSIPEPAALLLYALGLVGLGAVQKKMLIATVVNMMSPLKRQCRGIKV